MFVYPKNLLFIPKKTGNTCIHSTRAKGKIKETHEAKQ